MDASTRTPQHERRARTQAAVLRAAGRVFAARGYHGATLDDVAAEAGVSKGALYHYFPSKQALFLALIEDRLQAGLHDAAALIANGAPEQAHIERAAQRFLRRITRDPRWLPLLLEFLAYGSRDQRVRAGVVQHFLRPARERIAALARQLPPDGLLDHASISADELGIATAALLNGLAIERAFDPQAVPEDLAGRVLALLVAGLRAQAAPSGAGSPPPASAPP